VAQLVIIVTRQFACVRAQFRPLMVGRPSRIRTCVGDQPEQEVGPASP
jgi:hypothetical protein